MLDQRAAARSDGPGVAGGQGGHAVEGTVGDGAVHQLPGGAVPVLDDALEAERKVLVEPDRPGIAGRCSGDPAENATTWLGVGAGHSRPRRALPVLDDGLVDVQSLLGSTADDPGVAGRRGGHTPEDAVAWLVGGRYLPPRLAVPMQDQRMAGRPVAAE